MAITQGGSGVPGNVARQFNWQMDHYAVRGGPNDPVAQTAASSPVNSAYPATGGSLSYTSAFTYPPVPGVTPATPRNMVLYANGSVTSGLMTGNTASSGLLLLTIPKGSWIQNVELYTYTTLAGSASLGVFYVPASLDLVYPAGNTAANALSGPMYLLAAQAAPAQGVLYSLKTATGISTAFGTLPSAPQLPLGPGTAQNVSGTAAVNQGQLASCDDINIYVAAYGTGAPTAGCFSVMINFTGIEG